MTAPEKNKRFPSIYKDKKTTPATEVNPKS